jgi:hypothetical protein
LQGIKLCRLLVFRKGERREPVGKELTWTELGYTPGVLIPFSGPINHQQARVLLDVQLNKPKLRDHKAEC